MKQRHFISSLYRAVPALCITAVGLSLGTACKTKSAPDSGFLEAAPDMSAQKGRFPFQRVWVKPGVSKDSYNAVIISPVNTTYLMESTGWKAVNPGNLTLEKGSRDLAEYTRKAFIDAFAQDPNHRLRVVNQKGPGTVLIEIAIVELVPSKAVLSAVAIVAPTEISAPASFAAGKSSVAIEGRVRDSQTGDVLMTFADREEPPMRPVDLKSVTWWSHARESIDLWAKQMVKLANTPPTEKVRDEPFFRLMPW